MLKKFLAVAILGVTLIFTAAPNTAAAEDVFVGTSPATGWDCYLMSETISNISGGYEVTLKMIKRNGNVSYLDYSLWYDSSRDVIKFSNSQGYSGVANRYETPIEWEMWNTIVSRFRSPKAY